ncbi:MAG: hypothetical protein ACF8Q5_00380 [Phycisphaerales bacterium JB040]
MGLMDLLTGARDASPIEGRLALLERRADLIMRYLETEPPEHPAGARIEDLIRNRQTIHAIAALREATGVGIADATRAAGSGHRRGLLSAHA